MTRADTEILTVEDLAQLFSCDKETAAARLTSGDLPGVKVGRGWIIPRQALFERLNEKAREEAAARRAQQAMTKDKSPPREETSKKSISDVIPKHSSPLLTSPSVRGRRRRIPPNLPSLPS